jgi:branched-chain amino acid transport system substrate-binding protein
MLGIGLNATKGDAKNINGFAQALRTAKIDSPRGPFTLSKNHNPVQDFYLRKVVGKENVVEGIASKSLADPGLGCKM